MVLHYVDFSIICSFIQQLFDGGDYCTRIRGPRRSAWQKSACGICKTIGRETADLQITLNGILLLSWQIVVDGIVCVKMLLTDEGTPSVLGTVVAEIEIDDGLAFQHFL